MYFLRKVSMSLLPVKAQEHADQRERDEALSEKEATVKPL